ADGGRHRAVRATGAAQDDRRGQVGLARGDGWCDELERVRHALEGADVAAGRAVAVAILGPADTPLVRPDQWTCADDGVERLAGRQQRERRGGPAVVLERPEAGYSLVQIARLRQKC